MRSSRGLYSISLTLGICCAVIAPILGCESRKGLQMISQRELQEEIKIGQTVHLSKMLNKSSGTVCVLYPYQPIVASNEPHSAQINAHLKNTHYTANESHWALVFIENDSVIVSRFQRSEKLDILAKHEIQVTHRESFPKGFEPVNCAEISHASIAKIELQNRIFLVFGEKK